MDQWDDLLERSIAVRMAALNVEIPLPEEPEPAAEPEPLPPEEPETPLEQEEPTEAPPPEPTEPKEPPAEETPVEPETPNEPAVEVYALRQSDGSAPLKPGEIRTVTLNLSSREPEPETPPQEPPRKAGRFHRQKPAEKQPPVEKPAKKRPAPQITPEPPVREDSPAGKKQKKKHMTSLQARWLLNSMGAVSLVMLVIGALAVVLLTHYFYTTMASGLENKAQTAAGFFANYQNEGEYLERAADYVANFGDADSIELEFIDATGEIILSSYAYQQTSGVTPGTKDIVQALEAGTLTSWTGKDPATGERIMAVSAPVVQNGSVKGVIRMVTSMKLVDRQLVMLSLLLLAVLAAILLLIYSTNLYFVKSIAEPIAAITETTKRIAAGSYGLQIEKEYDDEIGELVDTINDMSVKVSQAEKVKNEFISSVSHELRTPLTAINGWGETLVRGEVTDRRDLQKGLAIIVSEARRLTKMVEELLEFSRIEDGRFTLRIEQIDIKAELEDAVYTYREFFRKKGISLEYQDCQEEFPPIPGDPERLRQVFSNLLDNAAKHGGSGRRITVSIHPDGDYVAICIRDYGHGIPPEELPHVKTKFYKGSSKARGSGIGLAVCDEIAQRHNGSLDIENAAGGGCLVTLRLPLRGEG
ncbi:MAG: ATP-binding protein [Oscillospiraceae bacterium]|nr:ATP-binding protein [Oscillospiraceae bacterium]